MEVGIFTKDKEIHTFKNVRTIYCYPKEHKIHIYCPDVHFILPGLNTHNVEAIRITEEKTEEE